MQIQVPLTVGEQMPWEAGSAEEGKQVHELKGTTQPLGVHSVYAREGRKPFPHILSGGARKLGVVLRSWAPPRFSTPSTRHMGSTCCQ